MLALSMKTNATVGNQPSPAAGSSRTHRRFATIVAGLVVVVQSHAQDNLSTLVITFEGPPFIRPETSQIVQEYTEAGFVFNPIEHNAPWAGFVRFGQNTTDPLFPANGTAYLQADSMSTLKFSTMGGSPFSLLAVDLAEYSTVLPDARTVHFVGYRSDGGTVTTDLTTDGVIDGTGPLMDFQTFLFGPEWSGLARVEIPSRIWSLDSLVVAIPEPASGTLLALGGLALWCLRRLKHQ
jgi:hypothetical protein